jgi:hypothetical protein
MAAIDKAIQPRAQVPEMIKNLAQDMASREELMAVVASLSARLDNLENPKTDAVSQPDAAPEKPAPKKTASKNKVADPAATEANG